MYSTLSVPVTRRLVIAIALVFLVLCGSIDYLTGYEISFAVFYLVPVGMAAWYGARNWALALAFASSITWYVAERSAGYPYTHAAIPVWNAFVRLIFFVVVALLLSTLRRRLRFETELARLDALTGLLNRRAFTDRLDHDLGISERTGRPLALAYLDLDGFKAVNDTFGHAEGDIVLRAFASTLQASSRRSDSVARLGGDEFALILPATDLEGAKAFVGKLRAALDRSRDALRDVGCSIGVVVFDDPPRNVDEAIQAADKLMYDAKRNRDGTDLYDRHPGASAEPAAAVH